MKLEELLHELRYNIIRDVSDLAPGGENVDLFADKSLLRYIRDAEYKFCRETWCLRDSTTKSVTQIILEEGQQIYSTHKSVIKVLSARYEDDQYDMYRSTHGQEQVVDSAEGFDIAATVVQQTPNRPSRIWTDETSVAGGRNVVTLNVFPAPSATVTGKKLYLRVIRYPTYEYSLDDLDVDSQVPVEYQLGVLNWAGYLAFSGFDADKGAAIEAKRLKADFDEMVVKARNELYNKRRGPIRMRYGQNGFTW